MQFFKILYPGLQIKRWLMMALIGIFMISSGLLLIMEYHGFLIITALANFFNSNFFAGKTGLITGIFIFILGVLFLIVGLKKFFLSVFSVVLPRNDEKLLETVFQRRQLEKGPKIVVLGGGSGLSVLLRGLKRYSSNLTAIVTVTDDGGSSGRLRGELGMIPPGDIRNCLLALADKETLLEKVLNFRFNQGTGLKGHNLGNLLLAALTQITGDFYGAVQEISRVLAIRGQVLPATLQPVVLGAEMHNGETIYGETKIVKSGGKIKRVFLEPQECKPLESAIRAIHEADAVVLGPGSLYTSIIPNLLVKDITDAILKARCPVFYVCNIMTQPGETDGYTAKEHLEAIRRHTDKKLIDSVIINNEAVPAYILNRYHAEGSEAVGYTAKDFKEDSVRVIKAPLLQKSNFARHDSDKLARLIIQETLGCKPNSEKIKILGYIYNERIKELVG